MVVDSTVEVVDVAVVVVSNVVVVAGAVEEMRGYQKVYGILNHNLFKHHDIAHQARE